MASQPLTDHPLKPQTADTESKRDRMEQCIDKCVEMACAIENTCCEDSKTETTSFCCSTISQCTWGVLLLFISIGGFIFTPLDFMLWEKLNMRPGFPPYEWWMDPPDEVKLRVYIFNVTNHERFLNGEDAQINLSEIGPIVYLEKLLHSNAYFNENSTMTYTARRQAIYLPQENNIDMNATIIVPNLAVLGMSSYLHNAPYFVRAGFRIMVNSYGSKFFMKMTIYEYLWDYKDPVLDMSKSLAPGLVPVNNMGMLARIYADFTDNVTVFVGPQWGHKKFFTINRFRGQPQLPGYDAEYCPDRIFGSTEGVMYGQRLTKKDVPLYWRKTVCKIMPLYFDDEITIAGVQVYRYNLSETVFNRVVNQTDCYDTVPTLPDGISDASKCYFDFPMVASYPHFYTGEPPKDTYVTGLNPDPEKHNSFIIVEPLTGIPFHSVARMQSNLRVHDLSGFAGDYNKFSNLVLPLFWAEYNQESLPSHISSTIYFMTVILPPLSSIIFFLTLLLGAFLIGKQIYNHRVQNESLITVLKSRKEKSYDGNIFLYEKEKFLGKSL